MHRVRQCRFFSLIIATALFAPPILFTGAGTAVAQECRTNYY